MRVIVLHMIEETAAHSGHLEIVRELIDGRTNLGLRRPAGIILCMLTVSTSYPRPVTRKAQ